MFPIKRLTAINAIANLIIVKMALIDVYAGILCVAMIFLFEHSSDVIRRKRKNSMTRKEERDERACSNK